jgi:predicted O-methyltransferase YrrM
MDIARLRQEAPNGLRRAVGHPRWFVETVRTRVRQARQPEGFTLAPYAGSVWQPRPAVMAAIGVSATSYVQAIDAAWWPERGRDHYGARPELATIMRAVVRLAKPAIAVETGVAQGVTTAVTLQAMADNGTGRLYSIDLPPLTADKAYIGSLVPERLRSRWTLRTGPSRHELPGLLAELGAIDLFLHDADHTYEAQTEEYEQAWPRLRPGGLLVSDDIVNPAFMDFAARVGGKPFLIGTPDSRSGLGLMRKP